MGCKPDNNQWITKFDASVAIFKAQNGDFSTILKGTQKNFYRETKPSTKAKFKAWRRYFEEYLALP